jgi:putative sigma-54 modulation protein
MHINLSGHHVELTSSLRDYVNGKLEKIERHFDHVGNVHVVLSVEKKEQKAEATVYLAGGELFADAKDENMYAAIDSLVDKLDRQIIKHKEKQTNYHRNSDIGQV